MAQGASLKRVTELLKELSKKELNSELVCQKMVVLTRYLKRKEVRMRDSAQLPKDPHGPLSPQTKKVADAKKKTCKAEVDALGKLQKSLQSFCKNRCGHLRGATHTLSVRAAQKNSWQEGQEGHQAAGR
jgi:hypothetical protein